MNTQTNDPQKLKHRIASALKRIPLRTVDEQEALRASILQTGQIPEAILLDAAGNVCTEHGRALVLAAADLGLTEIECRTSALDAETLLLDDLTQRRQFTKSAIAYLAYPLLKPAFQASRQRRVANLKNASKPQCFSKGSMEPIGPTTMEEFANEKGIGVNLFKEAKRVHDLFEDLADRKFTFTVEGGSDDGEERECTVKEWFEPKLLRSPVGNEHEDGQTKPISLGGVIKGIGYMTSEHNFTGKERPGRDPEQLDLWTGSMTTLRDECFGVWDKLDRQKRTLAATLWERVLLKLPDELLEVTESVVERRRTGQS